MGYPFGKRGWKLYDLDKHEFFTSRDVVFDEAVFPYQTTVPSVDVERVRGTEVLELAPESRGSDHDDPIDTVVTPPVDAVAEQGHTVAVGPEPVIAAENTAGKVIEAAVTEPVAVAEPAETGPP